MWLRREKGKRKGKEVLRTQIRWCHDISGRCGSLQLSQLQISDALLEQRIQFEQRIGEKSILKWDNTYGYVHKGLLSYKLFQKEIASRFLHSSRSNASIGSQICQ